MKKTVYALLVGIADYPVEINSLNGCVTDVAEMDLLFKDIFTEDKYEYKPVMLVNNEAKRNAVIKAFENFDKAGKNDICIFYYSGHGSKVVTDKSFWVDGSPKLESIVCYDSRFPSGYDLVDKEIAHLIYKATHNKPDIHFVSIMDCCFSGSNTRDIGERDKLFDENENVKPVEEFNGYSEYENGVPRRGRYIALSASQSDQPAKEKIIDGRYRGVFTYCLIHAIRTATQLPDYDSLMDMVRIKTKLYVDRQVPDLEPFGLDSRSEIFGQHSLSSKLKYTLYHKDGWKINKGSLHAITKGDLLRTESNELITVLAPGITESLVDVPPGLDTNLLYAVIPEKTYALNISFYISIQDEKIKSQLDDALQMQKLSGVNITTDIRNADYIIANVDNDLLLTAPGSNFPLFERVDIADAVLFLNRLTQVARWNSIVNIKNIDAQPLLSKIKVSLYDVKAANSANDDNIPGTLVDDPANHVFRYTTTGAKKMYPWLRLEIENKHDKPLCMAILYCSCDFGITDQLLINTNIDPGGIATARYKRNNGAIYKTIPVFMNEGLPKVTDYLLILMSEIPFQSAFFNLKSLPLDNPGRSVTTRSAEGTLQSLKIQDALWASIKLPVNIER